MSSGYIHCHLGQDAAPDLAEFERLFRSIGLHLENPETTQVLALSPTGEQIVTTREKIVSRLAARLGVNLQWWFTGSDDVYCGFHTDTLNGQWRVTLGLDGVDPDKAVILIERMLSYFKSHCAGGDAAALVVDRTGALEDVNWDAVVTGGQLPLQVPDILVLPRSVVTPDLETMRNDLPECPLHAIFASSEGEPLLWAAGWSGNGRQPEDRRI